MSVPDAKLFVGQIPRAFTEADLNPMFTPFGNIVELSIIRDKATQISKGCAFLIYSTKEEADAAIAGMHNSVTLPGMSSAIQVKVSQSTKDSAQAPAGPALFKLFVGMLPKNYSESELMPLFQDFGEISEVAVLRNPEGQSKGCAFVTYKEVGAAVKAITTLDGKIQLEGAPSKLVVKFAETDKSRAAPPVPNPFQPSFLSGAGLFGLPDPYSQLANPYGLAGYGYGVAPAAASAAAVTGPLGSNKEGPPGANLFIFHIPNDWNDTTLYATFSRFGTLLSSKVITDRTTGLSKGYGFVSFDTVEAANAAIAGTNGTLLPGGKRLKVEVKGTTRARPY